MFQPDMSPIQNFMKRVSQMNRLKQGDIRLSMGEALELSACVASILAGQLTASVVVQQATVEPVIISAIDGGTFKE